MLPIVALVGRPNVGKSTLFNRMVGKRLAIVHDQPGVTRDRHYADAFIQGHELTLIDTGGFDPEDEDPMRQGIRKHVEAAIEQADVIVCVLDALSPATEADRQAVRLLRAADKPVVYLANRADNERAELEASELYRLGVDPLICGSALHGRRMAQLEAEIVARLPEAGPPESPLPEGTARVALLGRPNAGKSSLLNRLSGEERSLVDDRPGTTRDPIDANILFEGKPYRVVDTAGMRRRSKVIDDIEAASVMRSVRCIWRSDVVVLMCDADLGVAEQDAKLLSLAASRGRAIILGLNKADLLSKQRLQEVEKEARVKLHFAPWVPIVSLSAKSGRGVHSLMRRVDRSFEEFRRRISTAQLNRFFEEVMERKPPPTKGSRAPRVYYVTQAQSAPPVFIVMCSFPEAISDAYQRFIANEIRTAFGFQSVPIKVRFRGRKQRGTEAD